MKEIILATGNKHKVVEIKDILKDYNIKFSFGDQADKEMYYHYINYKNSK